MIYIENITTSQQVYIPRQVINTGSTQNGGCIDLEDYYTREEVDELIEQATGDVTKEYVDDQDAATLQSAEAYTDQEIAAETARTESTYAKQSDIPSLDGYATEEWVEEQDYLKETDLADYAKSSAVTQEISSSITAETARTESVYAKKSEIPSLDGYATEQWVEEQDYLKETDLADYAKSSAVTQEITSAMASETARTESVYAKKSEIPSLDGYATEQWVEEQGYVTENDLTDYAKTSAVTADISSAIAAETARTESVYAKKSEIPSLDGYATEQWVEGQGYVTENDLGDYAKSSAVTQEITSAITAETARTESTYAKSSAVTQEIATAIASETARTESTYLKTGALDNYYTSGQTNAQISAASDSVIDWVGDQNYLQESDLADYAKTSAVTADIASAIASETARTESTYAKSSAVTLEIESAIVDETARTEGTYLKPADIAGKLDTSVFNTYTAATETEIDGKVDTSDFNTYTAATATELAGKQETLVSGTNIKTINNQSLLGSGNIDIQGGGGSGSESVIELTQAEYDALTEYAEDTTYIITDAVPINMDNYATTADTEAIADDVEALSGTVANKADKANVTSNTTRHFPIWNSQGIITGRIGNTVYERNININGSNQSILRTANSDISAIYAPTSTGTQNAVLLSNGSGAPVWSSIKMQFISQSAYDALTTKDASTIYFIISED